MIGGAMKSACIERIPYWTEDGIQKFTRKEAHHWQCYAVSHIYEAKDQNGWEVKETHIKHFKVCPQCDTVIELGVTKSYVL